MCDLRGGVIPLSLNFHNCEMEYEYNSQGYELLPDDQREYGSVVVSAKMSQDLVEEHPELVPGLAGHWNSFILLFFNCQFDPT